MILALTFLHPARIHLLWVALGLIVLLAWLERRGHRALTAFLSPEMLARLAWAPTRARRVARLVLLFVALAAGVAALMRPQTEGATETLDLGRRAADIVVVLDVSRSMLAEDAAPNRLERAKAEVADLLGRLQGHRVGLVAFAGRAVTLCPLTPDYAFFGNALRAATPRSVSRGGTRIGEALRAALRAFQPGTGAARLILLITDGEDHDSYPKEAAKEALAQGVRIVALGFGSEAGSEITLTDPQTGAKRALTDRGGQVVRSRLDGALLRDLALVTEGAYVPAGTAALDLEPIVAAHIKPIMLESVRRATRVVPAERFQWCVLAALVALVAAVGLGASAGRRAAR
ncbi:MAG TPA: VWA domain-containing protein [Polyangia bacterium]